MTIGFLHTAAGHVDAFRRLVAQRVPGAVDVHIVDESLLADAARRGVDADVRARVSARLGELVGRDVDVLVCTCARLADEVATLARRSGVPAVAPEQLMGTPEHHDADAPRAIARPG